MGLECGPGVVGPARGERLAEQVAQSDDLDVGQDDSAEGRQVPTAWVVPFVYGASRPELRVMGLDLSLKQSGVVALDAERRVGGRLQINGSRPAGQGKGSGPMDR